LNNSLFVIERARAEDAAALLDYLKIVGGETENLSFGAEGVPLDLETEQDYLRSQCESADNVQYLAKVDGEIIGTASLNRKPRRMSHRGEFGISLKKAWWGCGAASALTEAILAFAKENGFEQLNLEVRSSNARAIHLYEKYGFRKLCTFSHFFKINGITIVFITKLTVYQFSSIIFDNFTKWIVHWLHNHHGISFFGKCLNTCSKCINDSCSKCYPFWFDRISVSC